MYLKRGGPFTLSYLLLPVSFSEIRIYQCVLHVQPILSRDCGGILVVQPTQCQAEMNSPVSKTVCDSVLPDQGYSTFQRAVADDCGSVVE